MNFMKQDKNAPPPKTKSGIKAPCCVCPPRFR
jgi:hypothetical protein